MKIDKKMLPMKLHYFLFNAGQAPVVPFLPTFAKQLGFSTVTVGTIYTFLPIMGMLAKPSMGAFADKFHCQKALFISFILSIIVAFFVIPWIPSLPFETKSEIHCDSESDLKLCSDNLGDKCYLPRIINQGMNDHNITCHMVCVADAQFLESVCTTWHQPQYCTTHRVPSNKFIEYVNKSHNLTENYVNTKNKKVITSAPQTLLFDAVIFPKHTTQIRNCVHMKLGKVKFNGPYEVAYCDSFKKVTCETKCENDVVSEIFLNPQVSDTDAVQMYQFWMLVACLVIGWSSMAVVVSIGDAICFEMLGEFPSKYGNQRLWGSVGWGLLSIIAGLIVDKSSNGQAMKNYLPAFVLMAILLAIDVVVCMKLKYKQVKTSSSIIRDVGKLLAEVRVVIFMIWCICVGMCTALVWNFLFWHLEDLANSYSCETKNWIKTLEGLAMGIQCLGGELPFFFLSGSILKKIGHIHSMTLVLFTLGCRFVLYSTLTNPWWCLPIEFLNGISFGLMYSTMASYASIVAPPGTESTTQGIVGAVFEGVGVSMGSFIGGLLFKTVGGARMFLIFGVGGLFLALVHFVLQYFINKRTTILQIHERDFKETRYASPTDAIHMLEDNLHDVNLHN
ncbi:major facilitator superfamily domain-containing protein 6 isoform X2 [Cimex lectularius]|uniref:Major facilitator superfamily associated domain-containing protein n=1 Tax=Cimex lectularius TaxID=79782 RepID=A0A8I6TEF3_CIMLE|nr:major facilitator superfamily domain-containing protein 6 isoform X2 [Cimex lectularius]